MPLALSQCVEVEAAVFSHDFTLKVDNLTRIIRHVMAQKITHLDIADKTNALAVFFLRYWQMESSGDLSDLRLEQFTTRETGVLCLPLLHQC